MGVGTIVGSAVFNILCIIGVCGLFAGQVRPAAERGVGSEGTAWRWGQWSWAAVTWDLTPQEAAHLGLENVRHHCLVSMLMAYRAPGST